MMLAAAKLAGSFIVAMFVLLAAISAISAPTTPALAITLALDGTVTLAWDANAPTDQVTDYRVHYGRAQATYDQHVSVGTATTWTSPQLLAGTSYYFAITAVNVRAESAYSNEVSTMIPTTVSAVGVSAGSSSTGVSGAATATSVGAAAGDSTGAAPVTPQLAECLAPFGINVVSVFAERVRNTSGSVGSQARVDFQLASPRSPITDVTVAFDGGLPAQTIKGENLTRTAGIWFTTPSVAGTYPFSIVARNAVGCFASQAKDAAGKRLAVTVR